MFVYNEQVVDSLTDSITRRTCRRTVPVVGVYETMPSPGFNYQTWMLAEIEGAARPPSSTATSTAPACDRGGPEDDPAPLASRT